MKQTTFNFKAQFAPLIESGMKTSTIRLFARTQPPVVGDTLKLFTAMRQKNCRKLKEVTCQAVELIEIGENHMNLGSRILSLREQNWLATDDGFTCIEDLRAFFCETYGLPVRATWVSWH